MNYGVIIVFILGILFLVIALRGSYIAIWESITDTPWVPSWATNNNGGVLQEIHKPQTSIGTSLSIHPLNIISGGNGIIN